MDINKIHGLKSLIGNTPLLEIVFNYKGEERRIYAKAENLNMTGSIKDRMAFHILSEAYQRGTIKEGDPIFESTSGNTGISFSAIGKALGHQVHIFMPDWMSRERKNLIESGFHDEDLKIPHCPRRAYASMDDSSFGVKWISVDVRAGSSINPLERHQPLHI